MSRKWERMVLKNKKVTNKQRSKQGKELISASNKEPVDKFLGRSWFLPLVCVGVSLFFTAAYGSNFMAQDATTKFVTISYLVLGLFIYFLRRPSLSVGKTTLSSRRFSKYVYLAPADIDEIIIQSGYAIIQLKNKKSRWVFSRLMHRFDIKSMSIKLKEYALNHNVTFTDQTKGE
jgi:hypothetical protein